MGTTKADLLSSLASRLARLEQRIGAPDRDALTRLAGGLTPGQIAGAIVEALDADRQVEEARRMSGLPATAEPSAAEVAKAAQVLLTAAVMPIRVSEALRDRLATVKKSLEQTLDVVTPDEVLDARFAPEIKERVAEKLVRSFEEFIVKHKDEITALQVLYSRPYAQRLKGEDIQALADAIQAPPRAWTPEVLWRAYEVLQQDKVRGAGSRRLLTDVVSLVRFALHQEEELVPYADKVSERFAGWLLQQENQGRSFTEEQRRWLDAIRDHVAGNLEIAMGDFEYAPFITLGGAGRAYRVFGAELGKILEELNEVLAA